MDIDKITAEGIFTLSNMIDDQRMEIKKIKNTLIQHLENDVKLMDGIRDKMNKLNGGNE
jgi:type III secretory pathway lipoprotein EscJ